MGKQRLLVVAVLAAALVVTVAASAGSGAATATRLLVSRNGNIAFGYGERLLVVNPINGTNARRIAGCPATSRGCEIAEPAWSPNGRRLAFVRGRLARNEPGHMSLYLVAAGGGSAKRLAPCGTCGRFYMGGRLAWSPDGRWIVYSRNTSGTGYQSLWIVAAAGGTPHRLTDCASCVDIGPTWSPDGSLLLFTRMGRQSVQLYTMRPDGSGLTKITDGADPRWSPDGSRIAFERGPNTVAVADSDGSNVHVLLAGPPGSGPGVPSWSPDGQKLVFFNTPGSQEHFTAEVWTINPDGSEATRLYHSGCCVSDWAAPIWSPDGRMIAFSADSAGGMFVMNADGSGRRKLNTPAYGPSNIMSWQQRPSITGA